MQTHCWKLGSCPCPDRTVHSQEEILLGMLDTQRRHRHHIGDNARSICMETPRTHCAAHRVSRHLCPRSFRRYCLDNPVVYSRRHDERRTRPDIHLQRRISVESHRVLSRTYLHLPTQLAAHDPPPTIE
jgi:hypothetical protein